MIDGRYGFRGYTGTVLRYVAPRKQWLLEDPSYKASGIANSSDFPLGQMVWEVQGDPCYEESNVTQVMLSINTCNNTEFNCNDGHCIGIDERCNGKINCPDKSGDLKKKLF